MEKFAVGCLLKLIGIPGDYRARVRKHDETGLYFQQHHNIPYSAEAYELDMEDEETKRIMSLLESNSSLTIDGEFDPYCNSSITFSEDSEKRMQVMVADGHEMTCDLLSAHGSWEVMNFLRNWLQAVHPDVYADMGKGRNWEE